MTYREIFDAAIGDAPPSSIDLDGVILRQRRLVRTRRLGAYASAAGGVLALVLGAGLVVDRPDMQPAGPVSASRPPYRKSNQFLPSDAAERYQRGMAAALAARAPGVRWVPLTAVGRGALPTAPAGDVPVGGAYEDYRNVGFSVHAYPLDPAGAFSNELSALALAEAQPGRNRDVMDCGKQTADSCGLSAGPDGARVREIARVIRAVGGGDVIHFRGVDVLHRDGTWIKISLHSRDGRFVLTPEQLRDLALDPAARPAW
ncbi:hypothetical protein AB0883_13045 [Micromonospora sp. NPDC047812]|uniref:hypothetical protein n=1 Tax=Micromonospora sp. NPDC047812 TaxID=3155742 RepID=UPI003452C9F4